MTLPQEDIAIVHTHVAQQLTVYEKLWQGKFESLRTEIDALRLLKTHDIASIKARVDDLRQAFETALTVATQSFERQLDALRLLKDHDLRHINDRLDVAKATLDAAYQVALEGSHRDAVAIERRFEGVDEFRNILRNQANTFLLRSESIIQHENIQRELDVLRTNTARTATLVETNDKTSVLERGSLDKRLDSMNEFRAQLTDQAATFLTRGEYVAGHLPLAKKIEDIGKPNYAVFGSLASLVIGSIAAMWLVIGLKIENANVPISLAINQVKTEQQNLTKRLDTSDDETKTTRVSIASLVQGAAISVTDRIQLNDRLRTQETLLENGKLDKLVSFAQVNLELAKLNDRLNQRR